MRQYEECPDGVLDVYHMRNYNEVSIAIWRIILEWRRM